VTTTISNEQIEQKSRKELAKRGISEATVDIVRAGTDVVVSATWVAESEQKQYNDAMRAHQKKIKQGFFDKIHYTSVTQALPERLINRDPETGEEESYSLNEVVFENVKMLKEFRDKAKSIIKQQNQKIADLAQRVSALEAK
jgi:hypothetical protein